MKGIVTAGGKGTRLYPISRAMPKELIQFCGTPIIEYGINYLRDNDIKDVIVISGTKKGAVQDYIGNGEIFGVNVAYIVQEQAKGLGDAVLKVKNYLDGDNFVLLLGDTIFFGNCDIDQMINIHRANEKSGIILATILLEFVKEPEKYGVVKLDVNNSITALYEKPKDERIKEEFRNGDISGERGWYAIAGLYILNRKIFDYLEKTEKDVNEEIQLTDAIKLGLDDGYLVKGHILKGRRIDVGSWNYLREEKEFYNNMTDEQLESIINARNEIKYKK